MVAHDLVSGESPWPGALLRYRDLQDRADAGDSSCSSSGEQGREPIPPAAGPASHAWPAGAALGMLA